MIVSKNFYLKIFNNPAMKTLYLKKSIKSVFGKRRLILRICFIFIFFNSIANVSSAFAQEILFDFDNAPIYTSLPIDLTVSGLTAHLSATGQGFSIQQANALGFTPQGFAGRIIYPNSIYLADLLVSFNQTITGFSIMYCCQELGCDDAATMRVTAYMNGNLVGTNTKTARYPGTWPVDTLKCSFIQGFNSVVVHYDHRPPTCQDYGVIYLADNMRVTLIPINPFSLNLTTMIEGFWDGTSMVNDYVNVSLRNATSPFAEVDFSNTVLNNSGNGILVFSTAAGGNYYIVVSHRNSIETWSALPKSFTPGGLTNYNFTTAANQAYGSNQILKSGKYCMYSGDANQDGTIDAADIIDIYNDVLANTSGYVSTDVNGDDFVDASDLIIAYNNSTGVVGIIAP